MNDLRAEFSKYATDGYLGDPDGEDSYAYLRASSERQVEEGSSFPRQIENIHKAAKRDRLRILFDLIFFDDGFTGFEFQHRPALMRLRNEVKQHPRAAHLVIEDIDRLSRNADWQQGYLLEEFSRHLIQTHFFISPGSQLERYVRGYIAQEGMKKDLQRMADGWIRKAKDGRVTAKRPRYGYLMTDRRDTHYVLHPEESKIMRLIYEKLVYEGWTLHRVAKYLNDNHIPTRFRLGFWTAGTIYALVRSPVYKGEFYAHRFYRVETGKFNQAGKPMGAMKQRPPSEWIRVEVPAIVTPDEWEMARQALARNATRSVRNSKKRAWLLSGLIKCAICPDRAFIAVLGGTPKTKRRYYACNSRNSEKQRMLGTACYSPYVNAEEIERRVWEEIEAVIYDPELIIRRLDEKEKEERAMGYEEQIAYLDKQLEELVKEKTKFEMAYQRDIYTLDEFEERMLDLRARATTIEISRAKLQAKLSETHSIEDKKRVVLSALARIRAEVDRARHQGRQPEEIPFELKRKILSMLVDVITIDSVKRTFTIVGEISGTYALGSDEMDQTKPDSPEDDLIFPSTLSR